MGEKMYHAFWTAPAERGVHRLSTYDDAEITDLRKRMDSDFPTVLGLIVIYGHEVEFEPIKVVDTYRIKE